MAFNSEEFFDNSFLSYNKILKKLHLLGLTTKNNKQITELDLRKAINETRKSGFSEYKFLVNNKVVVSSSGVEWICKNVFKQTYLELLEKYKMELTELYIEAGYPDDNFFHRN